MAPKTKAANARMGCRMALANLAQPAQPVARQQQQQQANLHTLEVTVDTLLLDGAKKEVYHATRIVVADGNSVAAGGPAQYHGLNTFTPRAFAQMQLPAVPTNSGVLQAMSGMLPPVSSKNPYENISWIWMAVGYGTNNASSTRAAEFMAKKTVAVLTQAVLKAKLEVPAENGKNAWSADSTVEGNRIKLVRKGTRTDRSGPYEITELFHLKLRLSSDLSPVVRKVFKSFAATHSSVVTLLDVEPGKAFPVQSSVDKSSTVAKTSSKSVKAKGQSNVRSIMKKIVKKTVLKKRPAGR